MKIRMVKEYRDGHYHLAEGKVIDVAEEEAQALIEIGAAEEVEREQPLQGATLEKRKVGKESKDG